jgi:hypothetical protein
MCTAMAMFRKFALTSLELSEAGGFQVGWVRVTRKQFGPFWDSLCFFGKTVERSFVRAGRSRLLHRVSTV